MTKMSTKRFILYVESVEGFKLLPSFLAAQTHVQPLSQLPHTPEWLQSIPKPLLVDTLKKVGFWGTEMTAFMESKRPSKFVAVDSLSDTL